MKFLIKGKKGMYFTLMTIILLILFSFLVSIPSYKRQQEKMFVTEMRVESMNNLLKDIQRDAQRGLYISAHRAILSAEEQIITTGDFLEDIELVLEEAIVNGTFYGEKSHIMDNSTFTDWINKIERDVSKFNVEAEIRIKNVDVFQDNPWFVKASANITVYIRDFADIAYWDRDEKIETEVSIIGFEDPLYIVKSYGRTTNIITMTPYEGNYTYEDSGEIVVANLLDHVEHSYYAANPDSPSFLMRFENNVGSSPYGIESLVNLRKIDLLGLPINHASSIVDYYYWNNANNGDYRVLGTPSWFKLDAGHLEKYNVQDISYS